MNTELEGCRSGELWRATFVRETQEPLVVEGYLQASNSREAAELLRERAGLDSSWRAQVVGKRSA